VLAASSARIFRGFTLLRRGELAEAEEMIRASVGEVDLWGIEICRLHHSAYLCEALLERGDLAGARHALLSATLPPDGLQLSWWLASRVRLLLAEGRADEALLAAEDCGRRFDTIVRNPAWLPWRSLRAEALDRLGRSEEARAAAAEEIDLARCWGAPSALGRALRVYGRAARNQGLEALTEAVELLEASPARLEHAKALAALGSALRLAGRSQDARQPLRRALEMAVRCGAAMLMRDVRAELHAAGARPRREAITGVEALSSSERRVAELAAAGHTNREIAQGLYITPKTVEVHLTNVYRKLGVSSRRALPAALMS